VSCLTLLYSSEINIIIGFSFLEKNGKNHSQRAMMPIQSGTTARGRLKWLFGALQIRKELHKTAITISI